MIETNMKKPLTPARCHDLIKQGQCDKAIESLQILLAENPGDAEINYYLALAFIYSEQHALALQHCAPVISSQPDNANIYVIAGEAMRGIENNDEAIRYYRMALDQDPKNTWALAALAHLTHLHLLNSEESVHLLRKALEIAPDYAFAKATLAEILFQLGQSEEALEQARQAVRLQPQDISHRDRLASFYQKMGDTEEAVRQLKRACAIDPIAGSSFHLLANITRFSDAERHLVAKMESKLERPMPIGHRVFLHFALGKAYDDLKTFDHAFDHYKKGNALVRTDYAQTEQKKSTKSIISFFSRASFSRFPRSANVAAPIFVIGMPRCGSTLTEQLLSSHSQICSVGETHELGRAIAKLSKQLEVDHKPQPFPNFLANATETDLDTMAQGYLDCCYLVAGNTEKMLLNKQLSVYRALGLVALGFPHAKIIHLRRHPLDTCLSCFFQRFQHTVTLGWTYRLNWTAVHYRDYAKLMRHWQAVLPIPILNINYEDLINNPEHHARQMIEFCGLPWENQILNFHERQRIIRTASHDQARRPIYRRSLARWRNYAPHLKELVTSLWNEFTDQEQLELKEAGFKPPGVLARLRS